MGDALSRRGVLAGFATAVTASLAGCTASGLNAEETVTEEYDADGVGTLTVDSTDGDITVDSEERDSVAVTGTKRASGEQELDSVRLEHSRDGGTLSLAVEVEDRVFSLFRPTPTMELDIVVPETLDFVDAGTTNGDVEVSTDARVTAETTNGEIAVQDCALVRAETTNGDVTGRRLEGGGAADSTNGDIDLAFSEVREDLTAETTNGDVDIGIPASADVTISLETTNGDLDIDGLDDVTVDVDGTSMEATNGAGTHALEVETTNGDITIRGDS